MTDPAILGALAFLLGLIALVLICGAIVGGLRERAYQRAKEAEYAQQVLNARYARHVQERKAQRERDLHDHAHYEGKPE